MRVCVRLISTRPGRAKVAKLAADLFPRERKYQINWNDFWWWVGTIIWHNAADPWWLESGSAPAVVRALRPWPDTNRPDFGAAEAASSAASTADQRTRHAAGVPGAGVQRACQDRRARRGAGARPGGPSGQHVPDWARVHAKLKRTACERGGAGVR